MTSAPRRVSFDDRQHGAHGDDHLHHRCIATPQGTPSRAQVAHEDYPHGLHWFMDGSLTCLARCARALGVFTKYGQIVLAHAFITCLHILSISDAYPQRICITVKSMFALPHFQATPLIHMTCSPGGC